MSTVARPVEVSEYDEAWPQRYRRLRERIEGAVGGAAVAAIEHVGSTAVPGQAAKPVIDIDLAVVDYSRAYQLRSSLEAAGFRRELAGDFGDRQFYVLEEDGTSACHLSVTYLGSTTWRSHLGLRDRLRDDPSARRAYGDLKKRLAGSAGSAEAYTTGKTDLIARLGGGGWREPAPSKPAISRRRAVLAGLGVVLLLALAGGLAELSHIAEYSRAADGLPDHRAIRASDLWSRPPARLYYPGSTLISRHGQDASADIGSAPPQVESLLRTDVPPAVLAGWYTARLAADGWRLLPPDLAGSPPPGEDDLSWKRGSREYFELRIIGPPIGTALAYAVKYEIGTGR